MVRPRLRLKNLKCDDIRLTTAGKAHTKFSIDFFF